MEYKDRKKSAKNWWKAMQTRTKQKKKKKNPAKKDRAQNKDFWQEKSVESHETIRVTRQLKKKRRRNAKKVEAAEVKIRNNLQCDVGLLEQREYIDSNRKLPKTNAVLH